MRPSLLSAEGSAGNLCYLPAYRDRGGAAFASGRNSMNLMKNIFWAMLAGIEVASLYHLMGRTSIGNCTEQSKIIFKKLRESEFHATSKYALQSAS